MLFSTSLLLSVVPQLLFAWDSIWEPFVKQFSVYSIDKTWLIIEFGFNIDLIALLLLAINHSNRMPHKKTVKLLIQFIPSKLLRNTFILSTESRHPVNRLNKYWLIRDSRVSQKCNQLEVAKKQIEFPAFNQVAFNNLNGYYCQIGTTCSIQSKSE